MAIGQNLLRLRNKTNKSQQEIADDLGIDRKTYASWESGAVDVKDTYIPELAKIFNVEICELFKKQSSEIVINQHYTNNNDNSMNGIVVLLTDKESVESLMEILKNRINVK